MRQHSDKSYIQGVEEPWGFAGVKRETRSVEGDSRLFYVDPNNSLASDSNSGEDPQYPLLTVTQAVSLCRAYKGDTIFVGPNDGWTYGSGTSSQVAEDVIIPATKPGIAIIGTGAGPLGVYWEPATALGTCITVYAVDCRIANIAFVGSADGGNGIYAEWDGTTTFGENLSVHNCFFNDQIDIGIQFEYSWYCEVINCVFDHCDVQGVFVDTAGSGAAFLNIHGNWFIDCAAALVLEDTDDSVVAGNWIYNSAAQGAGAATDEGLVTTGGVNNLVTGNYFSCLLPVPAAGDIDDLCSGAATDAWVGNYCTNGLVVATPT